MEKKSSGKPHSSSVDQPSVNHPPTTKPPATPLLYRVAEVSAQQDDSDNHYSTINHTTPPSLRHLSFVRPPFFSSKEGLGGESEGEDERCHSLEAVNLNNVTDDGVYSNIRVATPPLMRQHPFKTMVDDTECGTPDGKIMDSPVTPFSPELFAPLPPPPPVCTLQQPIPFAIPKPRHHHQQPPSDCTPPRQEAEMQAEKETEESFGSIEAPGSFKHRLAEIISKDLAKFQPPLPSSRAGIPTATE